MPSPPSPSVVVPVVLRAGLDEGTDPKQLAPGTLTRLLNGVWNKQQRIEKRDGTRKKSNAVSDGTTITSAARLLVRGNELCLIDDDGFLYAFSDALNKWKRIGLAPTVSATWTPLVDPIGSVQNAAIATTATMLVNVWQTGDPTASSSTNVFVQILDRATGTVLVRPTRLTTSGATPRVVVIGTTAIVLYRQAGNLQAHTIDLTTFAVSGANTLRIDAVAGLDAMVLGANFVIAYGATASAKIASFDATLAVVVAATNIDAAIGAVGTRISIDGAVGESLYVLYTTNAGNIRVAVHNPATLAQTAAPTTIENSAFDAVGVCRLDATHCIVAYNIHSTGRMTSYKVSSAAVVDANSERGTHGCRLVSAPFMLDGRCYALVADYDYSTSVGAFRGVNTSLLEIETSSKAPTGSFVPHRYVAKIEHLVGGCYHTSTRPVVDGDAAFLASPYLNEIPQRTSQWHSGLHLLRVGAADQRAPDAWRAVTFGQESYLAGGVLCAYDGQSVFDYCAARAPIVSSLATASPGGSVGVGTYLYAAYPEYRSAVGVIHRGPTVTLSIPAAAAATNTINLVNVHVTRKQSLDTGFSTSPALRYLLPLYRSTANGDTYYRESIEPSTNIITIDLLTRIQTFADGRADTDIDGGGTDLNTRPILYTAGGIKDDEQPPALTTLHLHKSRLWGVSGDESTIWFSKSFQDDIGYAPGFSADFRTVLPGRVVSLATLDEKLVVLGERWISLVFGDGPAPNGDDNDFTIPQPLQTDVGCISPRSVVSTPDGVMFLSERGLYILTRGLETKWLGRDVKDELETYPNIVAAVLVPKKNQVRFACNNDDGDESVVLVFDYVNGQWSVFQYLGAAAIGDAILFGDTFVLALADGTVLIEDGTTFLDDADGAAEWVTLSFELAWLSSGGPVGWQHIRRVNFLGERVTDHDLKVEFGFDHKASFAQTYTFTAEQITTNNDCPTMRVGCQNGASPRCKAMRVRVTDATPTDPGTYPVGTGKGGLFSALGLEMVPQPGLARHGARHAKV